VNSISNVFETSESFWTTSIAALTTSGPMPSAGIEAMRYLCCLLLGGARMEAWLRVTLVSEEVVAMLSENEVM